jgi:hypothetical protein
MPVQNIRFMAPFTALFTVSQWLRHHSTDPACEPAGKKYSIYDPIYCPIYRVATVATPQQSLPVQNIQYIALFTVSQQLRLQYKEPAYTKYSIYGPIYWPIHRVATVATPQYREIHCVAMVATPHSQRAWAFRAFLDSQGI